MTIFKKWFQKPDSINNTESERNEALEIEEKGTPLLGKFFLLVMFILLVVLGWRALDDVYNIIPKPQYLSGCMRDFITFKKDMAFYDIPYQYTEPAYIDTPLQYKENYSLYNINNCKFSDLEINAGITKVMTEYYEVGEQLESLTKDLDWLKKQWDATRKSFSELQMELREAQVGIPSNLPMDPITYQNQWDIINREMQYIENEISSLKSKESYLLNSIELHKAELRNLGKVISAEYSKQWGWYRFWVFIVQLLFVIPIFAISVKLYLNHKFKNSPYTSIFTVLVAASTILLLRVVLSYVWNLFLYDILKAIFDLLAQMELLRVIVYYLVMILVVVVFGGLVYFIQKKIFDPKKVSARRLKKFECPKCEYSLHLSSNFCPNCGYKLKSKCSKCGSMKYIDMNYCPECGEL